MPHRFGSAVSAIALVSMLAGCAVPQHRAEVAGKTLATAGPATRAMIALSARDFASAVGFAEAAVEKTPDDAALRTLLGNAYFGAGRFASAEGAFKDSLTINSNQPQVILKLALVQTALGRNAEAIAFLEAARSVLDASDYGLALALAGRPNEAVEILDSAARQPGADATVRQNLALAHALAGDWADARTIAAQDVPADQLDSRIQGWMQLASPKKASDQVAALVGVTPAAVDPGRPLRFALARTEPVMAAAAPAPVVAPFAAPAADQYAPVPITPAAPQVASAEPTVAPAPPPPRSFVAKAARIASETKAMLSTAAHKAESLVAAAFVPKKAAAPAARPRKIAAAAPARRALRSGEAVVQLGSFRSPEQVNEGWNRLTRSYPALRAYLPLRARFDSPAGTYWRLSIQGFSSRGDAIARCEALRARGGKCFVRAAAGDAPVQIASN